jgi:hypothetical protein
MLFIKQIIGPGPATMNIKFNAEQNHFFMIIFNVFLGSVLNLRQLVTIAGIKVAMI